MTSARPASVLATRPAQGRVIRQACGRRCVAPAARRLRNRHTRLLISERQGGGNQARAALVNFGYGRQARLINPATRKSRGVMTGGESEIRLRRPVKVIDAILSTARRLTRLRQAIGVWPAAANTKPPTIARLRAVPRRNRMRQRRCALSHRRILCAIMSQRGLLILIRRRRGKPELIARKGRPASFDWGWQAVMAESTLCVAPHSMGSRSKKSLIGNRVISRGMRATLANQR